MKVLLGHDAENGEKVHIPKSSFSTHWHLIGGTGKGKTTAIHTLLHGLMLDPLADDCWFLIDRMGNFSFEFLLWATSQFCTDDVRNRIVYFEPANENAVMTFNPLLYDTPQHAYFKVGRATDCILRAWASQNIVEMPRLARWVFNAFYAAAQLGLTVADCGHLLSPGSPYHTPLLEVLPPMLKSEWSDILRSQGRATEILDSTRNRLKPYFDAPVLKRMFGSTENRLDVFRFMREHKIVVVNLSSQARISPQLADAIGGLVINEVLSAVRTLRPEQLNPTYLMLDEFQRFVGPDIEEALPETRQLQLKLILAHQSFSQLKRGDLDLTNMIFQVQSRLVFGVQGEDADLLAHEFASLEYDHRKIKEDRYVSRQRTRGHRIVELTSWSESEAAASNWADQYGKGWNENYQLREPRAYYDIVGEGFGRSRTDNSSQGGSTTKTNARSVGQHLVPIIEDYEELTQRVYQTFDEDRQLWARDIRRLATGEAVMRLVDDNRLRRVKVKRSSLGHLGWGVVELRRDMPKAIEAVEQFIATNYECGLFRTPEAIDRETDERLHRVLHPRITVQSLVAQPQVATDDIPFS